MCEAQRTRSLLWRGGPLLLVRGLPRARRSVVLLLICHFFCYFADFLIVFVDETLEKTRIEYSSLQALNRFAGKPHRVRDVSHKWLGFLHLVSPREQGYVMAFQGSFFEIQLQGTQRWCIHELLF